MNISLLEDAIALIEEGSMRAAAIRRNVTQPAFSRRIKSLEEWLGVTLVERHTNRIEIKSALRDREEEIRSILARISAFRDDYAQTGYTLTIGTQHSLSSSVFPEIYAKISDFDFVNKIRLRTRNQDEIISQFLKFEIDLTVTYRAETTPESPFNDSIIQRVWRRDSLIPVVSSDKMGHVYDAQNLPKDTPIINYPNSSEIGKILNANSQYMELYSGRPSAVETAFSVGVISLVKLGAGIGWVPQSLARDDIQRGELCVLPQDHGRIAVDVVLTAHQNNKVGMSVLNALLDDAGQGGFISLQEQ